MKRMLLLCGCLTAGCLAFHTPIYAAETDTPCREIDIEEDQEKQFFYDSATNVLYCTVNGAEVEAKVDVEGRIRWYEGYMGWFTGIDIQIQEASINGISYTPVADGANQIAQNVAYRYFIINGGRVRVTLFADEWGDVSIVMGPG